MGARQRMTMRAVHVRNSESDPHTSPTWTVQDSSFPCFVYKKGGETRLVQDGNKNQEIEVMRALVPLSKDIQRLDRFTSVKDRNATTLYSIHLEVLAVERHGTHQEVILREAGRTS